MKENEYYPVDSGLTYADTQKNYKDNSPGILKLAGAYLVARYLSDKTKMTTGVHLAENAEMLPSDTLKNLRTLNS